MTDDGSIARLTFAVALLTWWYLAGVGVSTHDVPADVTPSIPGRL